MEEVSIIGSLWVVSVRFPFCGFHHLFRSVDHRSTIHRGHAGPRSRVLGGWRVPGLKAPQVGGPTGGIADIARDSYHARHVGCFSSPQISLADPAQGRSVAVDAECLLIIEGLEPLPGGQECFIWELWCEIDGDIYWSGQYLFCEE